MPERLTLRWRPAGVRAGLALLDDAEMGPPLPSWPEAASDGAPGRSMLPLGPDVPLAVTHAAWQAMTRPDREFWGALLQALPSALGDVRPELARVSAALSGRLESAARSRPALARWLRGAARRLRVGRLAAAAPSQVS
jgi:hypothetical protein